MTIEILYNDYLNLAKHYLAAAKALQYGHKLVGLQMDVNQFDNRPPTNDLERKSRIRELIEDLNPDDIKKLDPEDQEKLKLMHALVLSMKFNDPNVVDTFEECKKTFEAIVNELHGLCVQDIYKEHLALAKKYLSACEILGVNPQFEMLQKYINDYEKSPTAGESTCINRIKFLLGAFNPNAIAHLNALAPTELSLIQDVISPLDAQSSQKTIEILDQSKKTLEKIISKLEILYKGESAFVALPAKPPAIDLSNSLFAAVATALKNIGLEDHGAHKLQELTMKKIISNTEKYRTIFSTRFNNSIDQLSNGNVIDNMGVYALATALEMEIKIKAKDTTTCGYGKKGSIHLLRVENSDNKYEYIFVSSSKPAADDNKALITDKWEKQKNAIESDKPENAGATYSSSSPSKKLSNIN